MKARNSLIFDEGQTQSAKVLALPRERTYPGDSNDSTNYMQVGFASLYIVD